MKSFLTILALIVITSSAFPQAWKTYPYTPTGSLISFPEDEGRHSDEPIEWWYASGYLTGETTGKQYSFMISYFYYPVTPFDGFRIFNISDDDEGVFINDTKALSYNILASDSLNIEASIFTGGIETWHNRTDIDGKSLPFEYELYVGDANRSLFLQLDAEKPPLILADSGFLYQGPTFYTYYYSQTKNAVQGEITFNGITENVNGTSWIDRQYGTVNPSTGFKYEWLCIQLSNGMDINLNNIFTDNNEIPNTIEYRLLSAYVDEDTQFTTSDFEIERLKYRYMFDSLRCYSQKWRITSALYDLDLIISALYTDNEVILPFRFYEGTAIVSGTVNGEVVSGKAFAELLHSYDKPDITITDTCKYGDISTQLTWTINNPDDGNPLKFDLEYSTDNQTFIPIAQNVADTFYIWDSQALLPEPDVWLKLTAFSIDSTLQKTFIAKLGAEPVAIYNSLDNGLISIYPNPSNGVFRIEGENISSFEVIDYFGRTVYTSSPNMHLEEIDISSQAKGVYYVKLKTQGKTVIKRILIQ